MLDVISSSFLVIRPQNELLSVCNDRESLRVLQATSTRSVSHLRRPASADACGRLKVSKIL